MRPFLGIALSLLFASITEAQYTYIVPVAGSAFGFRSQYQTEITALNPNAAPATVRYDAFYPTPGGILCGMPSHQTILPRSVSGLLSACFNLHALVVTSDRPLNVMADVVAFFFNPSNTSVTSTQVEPVEVATDWIAPESDAMIPNVRMLYPSDKANLVLVNPNDFLLTVSLHIERPELGKSVDDSRQVQPRSFLMTPVAQIPTPQPGTEPRIFDAVHNLTVRANGKFYAGVSNNYLGSSVFKSAVPLQP
jgi:hypothetical protein